MATRTPIERFPQPQIGRVVSSGFAVVLPDETTGVRGEVLSGSPPTGREPQNHSRTTPLRTPLARLPENHTTNRNSPSPEPAP